MSAKHNNAAEVAAASEVRRLLEEDKTPWYKKPNLFKLYLTLVPAALGVEMTTYTDFFSVAEVIGLNSTRGPITGVVNEIAIFERGDRGKDGLCVVVAVGREHRLGRWNPSVKVGRNGGVVFEIPKTQRTVVNGVHESSTDEEDE
ncbi:hypothetical protein NM208_g10212 [Fusarium decemcellulare]|uniref:Uncharacterized protein n=1 Tax=Fusarium decemcellulare TaxID=57161 RepID=A0ACC1RYM9_9HYPO|nr:hypothetical protein NM208_g10212 [Fusarium decemcellulare]